MANGLPKQTKTGAKLRASDNFNTSLTENKHKMRSSDGEMVSNVFFPVRLIHNGVVGGKSGRLEVYIAGQWGTICDDRFEWQTYNNNAALVVCRTLGFSGGEVFREPQTDEKFGVFDAAPILAVGLQCKGTEADIAECGMFWFGDTLNCGHREDIGINCD